MLLKQILLWCINNVIHHLSYKQAVTFYSFSCSLDSSLQCKSVHKLTKIFRIIQTTEKAKDAYHVQHWTRLYASEEHLIYQLHLRKRNERKKEQKEKRWKTDKKNEMSKERMTKKNKTDQKKDKSKKMKENKNERTNRRTKGKGKIERTKKERKNEQKNRKNKWKTDWKKERVKENHQENKR